MHQETPPTRVDSSLVVVASYVNVVEAEFALMRLDAHGIRGRLSNEAFVAWFWHYSNATGGVKLLVMEEDARESRVVLSSRIHRPDGGTWTCEGCGEHIDRSWDVCWRCETFNDGTDDPRFSAQSVELLLPRNNSDTAGLVVLASVFLFILTGGSAVAVGGCLLTLVIAMILGNIKQDRSERSGEDELIGMLPDYAVNPAGQSKRRRRRMARELTRRAWQSSVLALFMFPPLAVYSLYLLYRIKPHWRVLGRLGTRQYEWALLVNLLGMALCVLLVADVVCLLGLIAGGMYSQWVQSTAGWFESFSL